RCAQGSRMENLATRRDLQEPVTTFGASAFHQGRAGTPHPADRNTTARRLHPAALTDRRVAGLGRERVEGTNFHASKAVGLTPSDDQQESRRERSGLELPWSARASMMFTPWRCPVRMVRARPSSLSERRP